MTTVKSSPVWCAPSRPYQLHRSVWVKLGLVHTHTPVYIPLCSIHLYLYFEKNSVLFLHKALSDLKSGNEGGVSRHYLTYSSVHPGPIRLSCRAWRHVTGHWPGWWVALKYILPTLNHPLLSITAIYLARTSCTAAPLCLIGHLYGHWLSMWIQLCGVILWPLQYVQVIQPVYNLWTINCLANNSRTLVGLARWEVTMDGNNYFFHINSSDKQSSLKPWEI